MQATVLFEKSFGQLLYDLGFKYLCDGKRSYSVNDLDSKILKRQLKKEKTLDFPICVNKKDKIGRNFLTNPGVFIPPDLHYFFKEAKYSPDRKTFFVRVNVVKSARENRRLEPGAGSDKEMTVEEIRSSIALLSGGNFERSYRIISSSLTADAICG
jgi:hypothetical protein